MAKRLSVNSFGNVREKIAYHLIILEKSFNHQMIQLSREDLAAFCGMAKETLIRTLSEFKEEKLIEIDAKGISIKNNKKLECIFE
ncbi:MAG: winged helix-turn-helix domain-containing protein [Saprospiraceae bacterium]|nr:winged helix-turn-helix domain-containing protein [Candidatus Vicinibacter affinis]